MLSVSAFHPEGWSRYDSPGAEGRIHTMDARKRRLAILGASSLRPRRYTFPHYLSNAIGDPGRCPRESPRSGGRGLFALAGPMHKPSRTVLGWWAGLMSGGALASLTGPSSQGCRAFWGDDPPRHTLGTS